MEVRIPAFGSWDYSGDGYIPYTQCFETVHQTAAAGFIHYSYPRDDDVAGDLYANDIVTPAMIVVPRRRKAKVELHEKLENNFGAAPIVRQKKPKPVDEDLYKISPHLLYAKTNKKRKGLSFFSCWMLPSCV